MEVQIDTDSILSSPLDTIGKPLASGVYESESEEPHALRKYVQEVPTRNGSSFIVSMAQKPMGIRTQFSPAAERVAD